MSLNLVDICTLKYPGQIQLGNITFRQPANDILFASWSVPGIAQPLESDILAEAANWQVAYDQAQAINLFGPYVSNLLNSTAQSKQYDSSISICTYADSTNTQWKAEADAFIAWRDALFAYVINLQTQVLSNAIPIPTMDEFVAGLPVITWP